MMIILPCSAIRQGPSQSNESFIKDQGCVNRTPDQDKTRVNIKDIKWQHGKPKKKGKIRCDVMSCTTNLIRGHSALHLRLLVTIIIIKDTKLYQDNNKSKNNYYLLDFLYSLLWIEVDSVNITRDSTHRKGSIYDISHLSSGLSCILDCVQFCLTSHVSLSSSLQTERDDI